MIQIDQIDALRTALRGLRAEGARLALVPTMGNLHAGHVSLLRAARARCECVVATIFVNPSQFGPNEDLQLYPRTPEADIELLRAEGVDLLFMPSVEQVYPQSNPQLTIDIPELSGLYCGRRRPNHFKGVLLVVNILFNMIRPDVAVFGKKDYQQLRLIELMVQHLHLPIEIMRVDTGRDDRGLALSSRNQYLSAAELELAPELYQQLQECELGLRTGLGPSAAAERSLQSLQRLGFAPEYLVAVDPVSLQALEEAQQSMLLLVAAQLGRARLIDNLEISL